MSSIDVSQGIRTDVFLGVGVFLVVLPALFVTTRFAGSAKLGKQLKAADWLSLVAVILLAGTLANFILIVKALSSSSTSVLYLVQLVAASGPVAASSTWVAKAPILFLYIQIFGVKAWLRIVSYITLAFTFLWLLGWNIWLLYESVPRGLITPTFLADSAHSGSVAGVASGAVGLAADIVIFLIPIPVIWKLHLPRAKKIGLFVVFLTGLLAVVASAIGVYFKRLSLSGTSTDIKAAMILTLIELSIAIIVGCVPAMATFWTSFIVNSGLYSIITSVVSRISLTRSMRSKKSQQPTRRENTSEDGITAEGHTYDVLDDGNSTKRSMSSREQYITAIPLREFERSKTTV
ncbi:hypothetical protein F5Y09DRAFT_327349 [Xylaria sp. FL1042]|nr:hypothetical protein F5Y09DRAFT_327349 [Xylaria sp. FL1042]